MYNVSHLKLQWSGMKKTPIMSDQGFLDVCALKAILGKNGCGDPLHILICFPVLLVRHNAGGAVFVNDPDKVTGFRRSASQPAVLVQGAAFRPCYNLDGLNNFSGHGLILLKNAENAEI